MFKSLYLSKTASFVLIFMLLFFLFPLKLAAQQDIFGTSNVHNYPPAEQVFQFDYHQTDSQLKINFQIPKGFYLYQHRFDVTPPEKVHSLHPFPEGIKHNDSFFGETVIYRDEVTLSLDLKAALRNETLEIHYQGCADEGFCYPPSIQTVYLRKTDGAAQSSASAPETKASALHLSSIFFILLLSLFIKINGYANQQKTP